MKYFLILFLFLGLYSCSDPHPDPIHETLQRFYVRDKVGNDLLSKNNSNVIDADNIKVYYIINGKKITASEYWKQRNQILGENFYKGYHIDRSMDDRANILIVSLSEESVKDNITYTLLEWNENNTDTIRSKITLKNESGLVVKMIEYNNIKKADNEHEFTIIK